MADIVVTHSSADDSANMLYYVGLRAIEPHQNGWCFTATIEVGCGFIHW